MRSVYILCSNFLSDKNKSINIGGVETYVRDLACLCMKLGYKAWVVQVGKETKDYIIEGISVRTIQLRKSFLKTQNQLLYENVVKCSSEEDLIIISTDQMNIKSNLNNVIAIQHGIAFDYNIRFSNGFSRLVFYKKTVIKWLRCFRNVFRFYNVKNTVCVDYNFYNWFKTFGIILPETKIKIIPNYASAIISESELNNKPKTNSILFARRFVDYRGVYIFIEAIKRLLLDFQYLNITFAGTGPLESVILDEFSDNRNVRVTSYSSKESVSFHYGFDICVVPTLYSEGTSLSLLEGMAAGCIPLATHVGGMTNIIIDGFNGFFAYPDSESLYKSLKNILLLDEIQYRNLSFNAWNSVKCGFSKDIWEARWSELLNG